MKPRDCFGIIVRVMGLLSFLFGLFWVCFQTLTLLKLHGTIYEAMSQGMFPDNPTSYLTYCYAATFILIGFLLMRGADRIVKWLYPGEET